MMSAPSSTACAHQRADALGIPVDAVAGGPGPHRERLDHQRHAGRLAARLERRHVANALLMEVLAPVDPEQVDHHARGVEAQGLFDRLGHELGEVTPVGVDRRAVDVGDIGAHHQRGLFARALLEQRGAAGRQLDGVGRRLHQHVERGGEVLDSREEAGLAEEAVVDGDVEAAAVGREQAAHAGLDGHSAIASSRSGRLLLAPSPRVERAPTAFPSRTARSSGHP